MSSKQPEQSTEHYYVPEQTYWPLIGSIGLGLLVVGAAGLFQSRPYFGYIFLLGSFIVAYMMYGWFSNVIAESQQGLYSAQMDRTFRWSMAWFIFSEVMFFAAFFGALFYARMLSVPWLAGEGAKPANLLLWDQFTASWPLLNNPDPKKFIGPIGPIGPWPLPTINTIILMTSSVTITLAHHALREENRKRLWQWLLLTVILGITFLILQVFEYKHAYEVLGLSLDSGIYGTTFFMLTGFHGMHVTVGTIMLIIMLLRVMRGDFTPAHHFAFEATAWYWHFVDVVWIFLFIFVYIL